MPKKKPKPASQAPSVAIAQEPAQSIEKFVQSLGALARARHEIADETEEHFDQRSQEVKREVVARHVRQVIELRVRVREVKECGQKMIIELTKCGEDTSVADDFLLKLGDGLNLKSVLETSTITGKAKHWLRKYKVPPDAANQRTHSDDFREITWKGKRFSLTPKQAIIVRTLWPRQDGELPVLPWGRLKKAASIQGLTYIGDSFKKLEGWRELITSPKHGHYKLTD